MNDAPKEKKSAADIQLARRLSLAKARAAKHAMLMPKEKAFASEWVATRNGTRSALKVYDTDSPVVAASIASENLAKPKIRAEIARLMSENGIEVSDVLSIHRRNMLQDEHLPTSQKAVGDFYDILGMRTTDKPTGTVQIAFIIEK